MSYGFSIVTGSGATVTIDSDKNVPGVFIDQFNVEYAQSQARSYPSFPGTQLFVFAFALNPAKVGAAQIGINQANKQVTVTAPTSALSDYQVGFQIYVFGR